MAEQLFLFIQMEFAWALGPPDGRYLLRSPTDAEPQHVVVLGTVGARKASGRGRALAHPGRRRRWPASGAGATTATPEPATVPTARATIVDPVSVSAEHQAQAWLDDLDAERDVRAAVAVLNRLLHSHRIATADPYIHELSPAQAIVIRAGWGEGEQIAYGRWLHARELPPISSQRGPARRRRLIKDHTAALRPEERLAELLSTRGVPLLCEDLTLRARLDLDQGRLALAAIELERAIAAALPELRAEGRQDLALRIAEVEQLRSAVNVQARAAMPDGTGAADEEVVRHALERLEALLRARTAAGFTVS
jgi:hypothetical protein